MTQQKPTTSTKALIPPVVVVLLVVLASIFYSLRHPNEHSALTDVLVFYSYAALPHAFGLVLLLYAEASRRALAAGFLVAYWCILGGYLLFIGIFIFSAESLPRGSEFAWVVACGLSVWMIISGSSYRRLDRPSFSTGITVGAIFTISIPILLAMAQRSRH